MAETSSIKNRSVLVTGGTGALGRVVLDRFLKEGAAITTSYFNDADLKHLPDHIRSGILAIQADVSEENEVASLFRRTEEKYGTINILINIVGGYAGGDRIRNVRTDDWLTMMRINLHPAFFCAREFLRRLKDSNYGRIINIAALTALKPSAGKGPYAVSKGGVVTLTQVLGEELKGTGVTANAIAPSIIRTQTNLDAMPEEDSSRWVTPEEIAEMMMFLCSDRGRSINGAIIPMFGGVS